MKSLLLLPLAFARPNQNGAEENLEEIVEQLAQPEPMPLPLNMNWQTWQQQQQRPIGFTNWMTNWSNRPTWNYNYQYTTQPIRQIAENPRFQEFKENMVPIVRPYVEKVEHYIEDHPQMFDFNNPMMWMLLSKDTMDSNMLLLILMSDPNFANDPNNPYSSFLMAQAIADDDDDDDAEDEDNDNDTLDNMLLLSMMSGNNMMGGNNLLPYLLLAQDEDDSMDTEDLIILMMFSNGQMGNNQMLPWMLMTQNNDEDGEDDDDKMQDLLTMMMFSGQGMGGDMMSMLFMNQILKDD